MADGHAQRRIGIWLVAATVVLFAVQLTALALGRIEIAAACFVVIVIGWFALRSWLRRTGRI